jgi:hypothetical protein
MPFMPKDMANKFHDWNGTWAFGLERYDELELEKRIMSTLSQQEFESFRSQEMEALKDINLTLKNDIKVRDELLRKVITQFGKNYNICAEILDLFETPWYDHIPEHGMLVKDKNDSRLVRSIYNYDIDDEGYWQKHFEPLTNEEIERFKI